MSINTGQTLTAVVATELQKQWFGVFFLRKIQYLGGQEEAWGGA